MQYKISKKIIIDEQKLNVLIRLGCPDDRIISLLKTNSFEKTGDSLIDDTLECLIDRKEFNNWGGKRDGSGRHKINHLEKQDDNQLENQDVNQDLFQVVDKDIDKDIDKEKKNKRDYKGEKKDNLSYTQVKHKDNFYGELNNVRLTEEQYLSLKEKHPNIDEAIEVVDTWLGTSGSKYKNKNHYAYFKSNSWVWDRVKPKEDDKYDTSWLDKYEITNEVV